MDDMIAKLEGTNLGPSPEPSPRFPGDNYFESLGEICFEHGRVNETLGARAREICERIADRMSAEWMRENAPPSHPPPSRPLSSPHRCLQETRGRP